MRTTITLDDELPARGSEAMGTTQRSALLHEGLRLIVQREATRRLIALGGTMPDAQAAPRRRPTPPPCTTGAWVILSDLPVWIDHFRSATAELAALSTGRASLSPRWRGNPQNRIFKLAPMAQALRRSVCAFGRGQKWPTTTPPMSQSR